MLPERRHEVSRLEAFSDAAFAFALTLLVVSLDVPQSYDQLMQIMRGFPSFAGGSARARTSAGARCWPPTDDLTD